MKPHEWVNKDGEVLVLRFSNQDGTSYGGFQHPMKIGEAVTMIGIWPHNKCGGGIHGWPLGLGIGEGKDADWTALWQVYGVKPKDIIGEIEGGQKCKFRTGILRYMGPWYAASEYVLAEQIRWVQHNASGSASATGASGSASATGASGSASATGASGSASATGASGSASATGWSGSASATGGSSVACVTGINGRAKAGPFSVIALAWWNNKKQRNEMHAALVGPGHLKPDTWYRLDGRGKFVEEA
jgi:hypothetical protein